MGKQETTRKWGFFLTTHVDWAFLFVFRASKSSSLLAGYLIDWLLNRNNPHQLVIGEARKIKPRFQGNSCGHIWAPCSTRKMRIVFPAMR